MPLTKAKIRWGYLIAFLLLLVSYFLIFYIIREQENATNRVTHSYTVVNNLEALKAAVTDAETGVRGYIITSDVRFLKPYNSGSKNSYTLFLELRALTRDNKTYHSKLDTLESLIRTRLGYLDTSIQRFQRNGFRLSEEMTVNREPAKRAMDSIRLLVSELTESEGLLMKARNERLQAFFTGTRIIAITSLVIALLTIFYSVVIYNRQAKAREDADDRAREYRTQLEQRVSELNQANAELEELRSIEKFAATGRISRTIAHEVRNPLTNISLASEQITELSNGNPETEVLLEMIGRNVARINDLVSDLLNSTRFAQLEYEPTDINELLDETLDLASDRIELHRVKVETFYERDIFEIMVDREKMRLAFLNIIVNAIEAMPEESGLLQIRTKKQGDKCIIEFKDNGTGMDEDTLHKLFEPYFTRKLKGNGLGLTNTQNVILNHKGNINVRSKPGIGTSFFVTLNMTNNF